MLVSQGWTCWATSFPMVLVLIHEHWIFFYILMSSVKRLHCSYSPLFRLLWMGLFADLNFFPSLLINAVWKWLVSYMLIINLFYLATAESVYRNWEFSGCIIFSGFFFFLIPPLFVFLWCVYECVWVFALCVFEWRLWVSSHYCAPFSFEEGFPELGAYFSSSLAASNLLATLSSVAALLFYYFVFNTSNSL